jgi:hypothetical protein
MSRKVCILSTEETKDWTDHGMRPQCHNHRHVRRADALDMAHLGDFSSYSEPIAKLVGPHHIVMKTAWTWRAKASGRARMLGAPVLRTMQLVEGT